MRIWRPRRRGGPAISGRHLGINVDPYGQDKPADVALLRPSHVRWVLRRDAPLADMSDDDVFSNMAGRSVVEAFPAVPSAVRAAAPCALRVLGLHAPGVRDVGFELVKDGFVAPAVGARDDDAVVARRP